VIEKASRPSNLNRRATQLAVKEGIEAELGGELTVFGGGRSS